MTSRAFSVVQRPWLPQQMTSHSRLTLQIGWRELSCAGVWNAPSFTHSMRLKCGLKSLSVVPTTGNVRLVRLSTALLRGRAPAVPALAAERHCLPAAGSAGPVLAARMRHPLCIQRRPDKMDQAGCSNGGPAVSNPFKRLASMAASPVAVVGTNPLVLCDTSCNSSAADPAAGAGNFLPHLQAMIQGAPAPWYKEYTALQACLVPICGTTHQRTIAQLGAPTQAQRRQRSPRHARCTGHSAVTTGPDATVNNRTRSGAIASAAPTTYPTPPPPNQSPPAPPGRLRAAMPPPPVQRTQSMPPKALLPYPPSNVSQWHSS